MDLKNINTAERNLRKLNISKPSDLLLKWDVVKQLIEEISENAESLLQNDINEYAIVGVDHRVWTTAFYQHFKLLLVAKKNRLPDVPKYTERFLELINMTNRYYQRQLCIIKSFYGLDFDKCFTRNTKQPCIDDSNFREYYAMYKIFLYLGDINRYFHEHNPANLDYLKRAVDYYECAKWSNSSRSRAFYQIGLISKMRNDMISAVYNFTRSFSSDLKKLDNSKDVLLDLYDAAYKTFRKLEYRFWFVKSRLPDPGAARKKQLWLYHLDPMISYTPPIINFLPESKQDHFKNMCLQELSNNFTINFIHFLGKGFTKIGLESMNDVGENALVYFEEMISKEYYNLLPLNRGTQIMSLIMFLIHHIRHGFQCKTREEIGSLKHLRQTVGNFGLECFSILCDKLHKMMIVCDWDNPFIKILACLVNLWCLWFKRNPNIFAKVTPRPKFSVRRLELTKNANMDNCDNDVWQAYAKMLTKLDCVLKRLGIALFPQIHDSDEGLTKEETITLTPLEELTLISNFQGVKVASTAKEFYVSKFANNLERVHLFVRLRMIHDLGLKFFANNKKYKLGLIRGKSNGNGGTEFKCITKYDTCDNPEELPGICSANPNFWISNHKKSTGEKTTNTTKEILKTDSSQSRVIISTLKIPKDQKPVPPSINNSPNHKKWTILRQHRFFSIMVVTPKRLVLDTNCFIHQFELVKKLVEIVRNPILIPVAVILELRGLQKGGLTNKDVLKYGTADNPDAKDKLVENKKVAARCKLVLEYLNAHIGIFRVVTMTGRFLDLKNVNVYLRDDFYDPAISNDDRILDTCRYLEANDNKARDQGSPQVIFRKTVLITGDRNLRLKTYGYDIPTRHIGGMVLWTYNYRKLFFAQRSRLFARQAELFGPLVSPYADLTICQKDIQVLLKKINLLTSLNEKKRKKHKLRRRKAAQSSSLQMSNARTPWPM